MNTFLADFVMVLRQSAGRQKVILWSNANKTELTARLKSCMQEGGGEGAKAFGNVNRMIKACNVR